MGQAQLRAYNPHLRTDAEFSAFFITKNNGAPTCAYTKSGK